MHTPIVERRSADANRRSDPDQSPLQEKMKERAKSDNYPSRSERENVASARILHDGLCQVTGSSGFFPQKKTRGRSRGKIPPRPRSRSKPPRLSTDNVGLARDLARGLHPIELSATGLTSALQEAAFRTSQKGTTCRLAIPSRCECVMKGSR